MLFYLTGHRLIVYMCCESDFSFVFLSVLHHISIHTELGNQNYGWILAVLLNEMETYLIINNDNNNKHNADSWTPGIK